MRCCSARPERVAAAAGAVAGALALQSRSGAAELLAARFPDLDGRARRLLDWQGSVAAVQFLGDLVRALPGRDAATGCCKAAMGFERRSK